MNENRKIKTKDYGAKVGCKTGTKYRHHPKRAKTACSAATGLEE